MAAAIYHCYAKTPIGSAVAFTAVAVRCRVDESETEIGNGSGRTGEDRSEGLVGGGGDGTMTGVEGGGRGEYIEKRRHEYTSYYRRERN